MVYTKHFPIHSFDRLHQSEIYIQDALKTKFDSIMNASHLDNLFQYVANDDKTISKKLVSSHGVISVDHAYEEFKMTKLQAEFRSRSNYVFDPISKSLVPPSLSDIEKRNPVLARHLIQSFSPEDKLTPEQVHEIGRKTILEFTGGDYEFVIATHVDKEHLHNHIIVNTTNIKTGKALPWKIASQRNGVRRKDMSKEMFEKVSDKISSQYGAKIIEKSPKNSHKKYTMWQTESIYKSKIKSRLDFLLEHSHSVDDFFKKADVLNLHIDFSKKWSTFRLLDEPQIKNTRGRNLSKAHPEKYNLREIEERLKQNDIQFTIEDIVSQYEEKTSRQKNDFDYQVTIEDWQISHKTERGYYVNVDFGVENRGQVFIGAYKVDELEDGLYNLFVKKKDYLYFMNDTSSDRNRYMSGETFMKQMKLYNGNIPLKKEPVMNTLNEVVSAINFLAENEVTEGRQLSQLENRLSAALIEAERSLNELDDKIIQLNQVGKILLSETINNLDKETIQVWKSLVPFSEPSDLSFKDVQDEVKSVITSRDLLKKQYQKTIDHVNNVHRIQAMKDKNIDKENVRKI